MEHSIFAMEVCARLDRAPTLVQSLRAKIQAHPKLVGLHEKWEFYRACTGDLLASINEVERGCWDFFDEDQRAQRDYKMWCDGMITEEGARVEPSEVADPYRQTEARYLTFTMAFLLVQGSETERAMAELCAIPEALLWKRDTFIRILSGLGVLSFASVESDVVYLIPRDEGWGLTLQDLQDPKFSYLRELS